MSLLDPDYQELGNPDKDLTAARTPLDLAHHDVPERHGFGKSLFVPNIVRDVGATAADVLVGKSPAPAREDHVHGPGNHGHSGYSPTSHTHNYSDPSHTHPAPPEQVAVGGKRIATGPSSGSIPGLGSGPAASTTNIMIQTGTLVGTTDASGYINIVFPQRFPNGIFSVIISVGFIYPIIAVTSDSAYNQDFMQCRCYNLSGTTVNNGAVRINWIATGW